MKKVNARSLASFWICVALTTACATGITMVLADVSRAQWVLSADDGNIYHCAAITSRICTTCEGKQIEVGNGTVSKSEMCASPTGSATPPSKHKNSLGEEHEDQGERAVVGHAVGQGTHPPR